MKNPLPTLDYDFLRNQLKLKHLEVTSNFRQKYPKAHKYLSDRGVELQKIRQHSAKILSAGALTGALLVNPIGQVQISGITPSELSDKLKLAGDTTPIEGLKDLLLDNLRTILPQKPRPLQKDEEKLLETLFNRLMGLKVKANLEGEHLNTTYGYIGAEQHLRRFPGDTVGNHGSGEILHEGMAPGLGAWGYFAYSKSDLTDSLAETEKWYAVVQTLYLPDWGARQPYLQRWYKYRKVLIVNTDNGNAVVAAIGDSGPAAWTGKHFGGSSEVMEFLGGSKYKKGPVLIFFVDDPENKVPLGPVEYGKVNLPMELLSQT